MTVDAPRKDMEEVLAELKQQWEQGTPLEPDMSKVRTNQNGQQFLPTGLIKTRVAMFQPRSMAGQAGEEHVVLEGLVDALKRNGVDTLDPVVVWWSGTAFYCVDGHHRIIAIRRFNKNLMEKAARNSTARRQAEQKVLKVPVTIIEAGTTLSEATKWSSKENGKVRLSLRKNDLMDWAWKLLVLMEGGVMEGKFNQTKRSESLHVSVRSLSEMAACFRKITKDVHVEEYPTDQPEIRREAMIDLADVGWGRAKRLAAGQEISTEPFDETKRQLKIEKIAKQLIKNLGPEQFRAMNAELIGEALLHINDNFMDDASGSYVVKDAFKSVFEVDMDEDVSLSDLEEDF